LAEAGHDYQSNQVEADGRWLQQGAADVYLSYFAFPVADDLSGDAKIAFLKVAYLLEETVNRRETMPMCLGA
jgi:hypothetical protein